MLVLVAGCSSSSHTVSKIPTTTSAATAVTVPALKSTVKRGAARRVHCRRGFDATAVSFADPIHGWSVGAAPSVDGGPNPSCVMTQVSVDGGVTWSARGSVPMNVTQVVAQSSNEAWVWGPNLAHTVDGGRHWTVLDRHGTTAGLAVQGASVWWLYRCGQPSSVPMRVCVARSDDDGGHWQRSELPVRGLPDGPDPTSLGTQFVRPNGLDGWLLVEDQIHGWQLWRSTDGAMTWQPLPEPCAGSTSPRPKVWVGGVANEPRGPLTALDGQHLFLICTGGAGGGWVGKDVLASSDGGLSWLWTGGNPAQFGDASSMATPTLDTIVWSGGRTGLNASFDGGRTWTVPTSTKPGVMFNPGDGGLWSIVFVSPEQGWAIGQSAVTESVIWRTTDAGHSWTPTFIQ